MINLTDNQLILKKHALRCPAEVVNATSTDPLPSIVVADDDDFIRQTIALVLTNRGFHVRCAANGDEAWHLLCEFPFSLLITDNDMPGPHGLDIVRRMRAASFVQPVILMSGNIPWGEPDLRELLTPGMTIQKPFGVNQLVAAMSALDVLQPVAGRDTPHFASAQYSVYSRNDEKNYMPMTT